MIFLGLLVFFGCVAAMGHAFDLLLRYQHTAHRAEWLSAGKPCGYFHVPDGTNRFGGNIALQRQQLAWLFRSPAWISEQEVLGSHLTRLRIFTALLPIVVLGVFAASIIR